MSFHEGTQGFEVRPRPALASPLDAAVSAQDRETLAMVASALKERRMRLAFQPVVYAADPTVIGFFEGFIRLLNLRDQVIPARDFMAAVEQRQLGARHRLRGAADGADGPAAQPADPGVDQHVGPLGGLSALDGHPEPRLQDSPRSWGQPDPGDQRGLGVAGPDVLKVVHGRDAEPRHRLRAG